MRFVRSFSMSPRLLFLVLSCIRYISKFDNQTLNCEWCDTIRGDECWKSASCKLFNLYMYMSIYCIWLERMEFKSYIDGLFASAHCAWQSKLFTLQKFALKVKKKNPKRYFIAMWSKFRPKNAKNLWHCTLSHCAHSTYLWEPWRFLISLAIDFMVWLTFFLFLFVSSIFSIHLFVQCVCVYFSSSSFSFSFLSLKYVWLHFTFFVV